MKTNPLRTTAGFTLIELMAVITIMVLLAGLVVGGMAFVTDKQNRSKAKIQIEMISQALQDYKYDNGAYPLTTDGDGTNQSDILFNALYYNGANNPDQKIYIPELDPINNKQGWTSGNASASTEIVDPWGNEYRYRTANGAAGANAQTQNPDFDLWSAGKDGKTNPDSPSNKENLDDIKNF